MDSKKTVLVCGDPIYDHNLVEYPVKPDFHQESPNTTFTESEHGGFWYLADMIKCVCSDISDNIQLEVPPKIDKNLAEYIPQAYQIWKHFDRIVAGPNEKKEDGKVLRIENFLGCHTPKNHHVSDRIKAGIITYKDILDPDILVIDDMGLNFCKSDKEWPMALKEGKYLKSIILKVSVSLGMTTLWSHLKDCDLLDKLTVVISVESLRRRGAEISKALSWDKTIEEVKSEFKKGVSAQDLANCKRVIVIFGDEGIACMTKDPTKQIQLERFIYNPDYMEGSWEIHRKGRMFGTKTIITSALVRHELVPDTCPFFIALTRGLPAVCGVHDAGAGADKFNMELPLEIVGEIFHSQKDDKKNKEDKSKDDKKKVKDDVKKLNYCSTYNYDLLYNKPIVDDDKNECNLLKDVIGRDIEYVYAKAIEIVLHGTSKALEDIPKARYGKYLTVDREEIQRINAIRNMIISYRDNPKDTRPLSIAVFGCPGSGKSFAMKELASHLFGKDLAVLKFNLSQFDPGSQDFIKAFQEIRDKSIESQIPLVFWDEFDTDDLKWLKSFLAPMEEAKFQTDGKLHPFGKAIFVFAGGTCHSFEDFENLRYENTGSKNRAQMMRGGKKDNRDFKDKKGPDFISRLRGFVNIKSANPPKKKNDQSQSASQDDYSYIIRRASILRSSLEDVAPSLFNNDAKIASVSTGIIRGFLMTKEFLHEARSIDSLVRMSSLPERQKHFGIAQLPSEGLLSLHVKDDFIEEVRRGELDAIIIEALAEACHKAWKEERKKQNWKSGTEQDKENKTIDKAGKIDYRLVEYDELDENDKENNRKTARLTKAKLTKVGCSIVRKVELEKNDRIISDFGKELIADKKTLLDELMLIEHDIWLRNHLIRGFSHAQKRNDDLKLHPDITEFDKVPPADKVINDVIIRSIIPTLRRFGYVVVKKDNK